MSSQQSNQSNNFNKKFDPRDQSSHYQPLVSNRMQVQTYDILTSNLDLYIPRVSSGTTEEQVKSLFYKSNIGTVEYCDFATTKDKDTKKPQYTSAFIKLNSWSPTSGACEDFAKNKSIRLHLSRTSAEFWIILPNNNPLPRSHVNTSQLAASTEKLFEQTERITEKANKFEDEMRATISEMRQMMALQQEKIETLEFQLKVAQYPLHSFTREMNKDVEWVPPTQNSITLCEQYPEIFDMKQEQASDNIVYSIQEPLVEPLVEPLERDYDAEVDALLDAPLQWQIIDNAFSKSDDEEIKTVSTDFDDSNIEQLKLSLPIFPRLTTFYHIDYTEIVPILPKMTVDEFDEDELIMEPIPVFTKSNPINNVSYNEEDECVFSNRQNQGQKRAPILKMQSGSSKLQSLGEIVAENPERAIGSRDLCGNL
jgi:hypothetical protein